MRHDKNLGEQMQKIDFEGELSNQTHLKTIEKEKLMTLWKKI